MNRRILNLVLVAVALLLACARGVAPSAHASSPPDGPASGAALPGGPVDEMTGVPMTVQGTTVTLAELRSRTARPQSSAPREAAPRRTFGAARPGGSALAPTAGGTPAAGNANSLSLAQSLSDEILGLTMPDTAGYVPPDTMGAVGPTQFLFSVNTNLRAYNKNSPHTQIFDVEESTFWGSTADAAGVSDTHVRYDRATQRWFITEIDIPNGDNHILLAVSSGPDLSTASWTQFALAATAVGHDQGCFADYDTPGIDQNAIYIGANMFQGIAPCAGNNYLHTNLYVIQKASALTATLHFTSFYNVVSGTSAVATIQGVDSVDALSTGYAVAVKETESPQSHLNVWTINSPATLTPTLSGPATVAISAENGSTGGVLAKNNVTAGSTRPMDDVDDRLFAATIRNGHLWTAHNVAVNSSGSSSGLTRDRDAMRWYDVNIPALTLNQSGTVYDSTVAGPLEYWMGTVMISGQGHVLMGLNRANATTNMQAGLVGRLAGDAAGTMSAFTAFQNSTADGYDDFTTETVNRWGDYSYTSLDPCDDMTMWTVQEYVAGSAGVGFQYDWGTAAEKVLAPPPAALPSITAAPVGKASVDVFVTGSAAGGAGFYDTPNTLTDPCRKRLGAAVTGVSVNSVTYIDPTHMKINLNTIGATPGPHNVTITNPDGQTVAAQVLVSNHAEFLPLIRRP